MSWEIRVPFSDPSDELIDVALAARALPDREDRLVVRELVLESVVAGDKSAADVLDRLKKTKAADRRSLLDRLRVAAGLPTTADAEATRRYEAANHPSVLAAKRRRRASLRMSGGGFVEVDPDAIEAERLRDQLREEAFAERVEERKREAAERAAREKARQEQRDAEWF